MPTRLTPEQRTLYKSLLAQGDLGGSADPLDSSAFARKMLQPNQVEMVRKRVSGDPRSNPRDSAAFYETYRSPVINVDLTDDDLTPPKVSSSREGTYDTLRYPALGDIPEHTRVEFRPSINQRVKDLLGDVPEVASGLLRRATMTIGQSGPTGRINALREYLESPDSLDAVSGAAARPRATQRRDSMDAKTTNGTARKR